MAPQNPRFSPEVSVLLDAATHPFRYEIDYLRHCILSVHPELAENVKWNGPNYSFHSEDRITMRVQPPIQQVQLILHRGAKKQEQPPQRLIAHPSKLLVWKENDRAIITFKDRTTIENAVAELKEIIGLWLEAAK